MSWTPFNRTGRVLFSFEPSGEYQIALQEGERVQVTEQASGWFKGTVLSRQPPSSGIFPASYIKLDPEGSSPPDASASASSPASASAAPETRPSAPSRAPALPQRGPSDSSAAPGLARSATVDDIGFRSEVSKASAKILEDKDWEGLFAEINGIMNEWSKRLVVLLTSGDADAYHDAKESMSALLELRARVLRETDESRREVLRTEIIHLIERGRESQEGFLVTRTKDGDIADVSNTPTVSLLEQHRSMDKSLKTEREEGWRDRNQARRRESLLAQGALNAPPVDLPKGLMQLYLDVQMCIFSAHENTELFFSLYNRAQQAYITDDFLVSLTDLGLPHNKMLIGKLYTLFKDLDRQSFDGGLYLVCKIFRRGRLVYAPTKKPDPKSDYRRPFGCMVMNLSTAGLTDFEKHEFPPQQIYVLRDGVHEKNWCKIVDLVLSNDNKLLEPLKKAKGVVMALQLHTGTEEEVRAEFEYDPEVVATTPRFEFPEQMQVTDNRNDFYVFLDYGQFLKDGKRSEKNIEVHVQVLDSTGQPRENCIVRGCGPAAEPQTEFKSLVYYHWNTPSYDEAIRVLLDVEQFHDSHLFLSFWHVSSKASKSNCFSWGYFKLTRDRGAVVADAIHTVNTFTPWHKKLEKNTGSYLEDLGKYKRRKDPEIFHVRSKLVSTIQTQNATLHTLFNWRTVATPVLLEALKDFARFNRTSVAELAKFVRETFDVLFAIMASPEHVECHTPALDATLHALGLLTDRKIQTYIPIVDSYVTSLFKEGSVHVLMIEALTERFTSCDNDPDMKVMNLARSLDYVLKFAVASRLIDVNSDSPTCDDATFKANLQGLFTPLFELMAIDPSTTKARYLQQTQSFLIRSFPRMVEDLGKVFSAQETGEIARRLVLAVDNVPRHTISKLNLVRLLIKGNVVEHADFRAVFTPVVLSVLKRHMAELSHESPSTSESYLCISIVGRLLNSVQTDMMATADPADRAALVAPFRDVLLEMLNMVDFIQRGEMGEFALKRPSETVRNFVKVDMLLDGVTVLWTALHALEEDALGEVFSSQPRERLVESARRLLRVASTSLQHRMYEPKWVALVMLHLHIVTKVLRVMGSLLRQCFASDSDDFDTDVWNAYFVLSLQMLSLDRLRLSSFSAKKREFVLARYGDLREGIMEHIRELWTALGARRADFAGNLIPLIFDLAASTSKEDAVNDFAQAADLALDMFYDMLRTEFEASGSFDEVERHTIDALYRMIEHKPDECDAFVELVLSTTRQSIQATGGGALVAQGDAFLDHVQRMYDLMSSLLQFPHTELYEDERTSVVLKIIHYLETSGHVRKEMTSRYMQYLVDLHAGLGNFVEAGITQLALYNLLDFSDAPIDRTDMFPREPERERKVRVLKLAVANLVQGEDFERAIGLLDLLVAYYRRTYQYRELSAVLAEQSDLYAKIMDTQRFYCNFYQVGYYGDFADEFKGKVFVYKGNKLESVMAFTSRMRTKFPDAKIHMSSEEPSEELVQEHGQVIGITTLTPERAETDKAVENGAAPVEPASQDAMPIKVAAHLNANDIKVFSYAKPDNRSPEKRPKNEFKDMWKFTTYLETTDSLPCNRRRVEIASRRVIESPPIENAVQAMEKTNAEFHLQLRQLREAGGPANAPDLVQPVAMRVGGAVDAAVNGGVLLYIEAFLCPEFATEHPEWVQYQQPLRDAIKASLELCDEALELLSPPPASMEALMEHLTSTQAKNKESYAEVLGL